MTVFDKRILVEKIMEQKSPLNKELSFTHMVKVLGVGLDFPQHHWKELKVGDVLLVSGVQEFEGIDEVYVMPSQILRWVE